MPKPICVKCQRFYRVKSIGWRILENRPEEPGMKPGPDEPGWVPYKLWCADLFECPNCSDQIVTGYGQQPYSEGHYEDFQARLAEAKEYIDCKHGLEVNDCA